MKKDYVGIVDVNELERTEIFEIFDTMKILKEASYKNAVPKLLNGKTLMMIFEEPSTRTRTSFEAAMTRLGGHAQYLKPGEIHLGDRESIYDTIKVLSRFGDRIFARVLKHETIQQIAKYSDVPVFNGLSDYNHPTQMFGDFFTIFENLTDTQKKNLNKVKLVFIGDRTNVCSSLMMMSSIVGINFVHVGPKKYQSPKEWVDKAQSNIDKYKSGSVKVTDDLNEVSDADFVYTDLWWWVDQVDQAGDRYKAFMKGGYQANADLASKAKKDTKFMHCLPCSRNVELADEVIDGKQSIVFDQSENKLYLTMGLLTYYIYPNNTKYDSKLAAKFEAKVDKVTKKATTKPNSQHWTYNNNYKANMDYLKGLKLKK